MVRRTKRKVRRPRSRYSNYAGAARQLYKDVRMIKNVINVEYKYYDINTSNTLDNAGSPYSLCTPLQGLKDYDRTGDSIKLQNITMKGTISYNPTLGGVQVVRVIILNNKQNRLTEANFLEISGASGVVYSPRDRDNRFWGKTIVDKTFTLTDQRPAVTFSFIKKLLWHQQFENNGITVNDGRLQMFVYSNNAAGANQPAIEFFSRTTYTDN
jgi:hypothetical protein